MTRTFTFTQMLSLLVRRPRIDVDHIGCPETKSM